MLRGRGRDNRTYVLLIMEKYINTRAEPTGVGVSLANVDNVYSPAWEAVPQDATCPLEQSPQRHTTETHPYNSMEESRLGFAYWESVSGESWGLVLAIEIS